MIPLLCETITQASETSPDAPLALVAGVLLIVGGLLVKRKVR